MKYTLLIHECGAYRLTANNWIPAKCDQCGERHVDPDTIDEWIDTWMDVAATTTVVAPALASGPGTESPKFG